MLFFLSSFLAALCVVNASNQQIMKPLSYFVSPNPIEITMIQSPLTLEGIDYQIIRGTIASSPFVVNYGIDCIVVPSNINSIDILYKNLLSEQSLIHAHGLQPQSAADGVPYISSLPLFPKRTILQSYPINPGSHFLTSSFSFQSIRGLKIPLIVSSPLKAEYPNAKAINGARDLLFFLQDFCPFFNNGTINDDPTCAYPDLVYAKLLSKWLEKSSSFNYTACDPANQTIIDVDFRYHLANGQIISNPYLFYAQRGEFIRLRIINGASMSNYRIDLGLLLSTSVIIMVDGNEVQPLTNFGDLWLAAGQRMDIMITAPLTNGSYPIFAFAEGVAPRGQSGIILVVGGSVFSPPKNNFPLKMKTAVGMMNNNLEATLRAFYPLADRPVNNKYTLRLTGENGFNGLNSDAFDLPPFSSYIQNPNPLLVSMNDRTCVYFHNFNARSQSFYLHGHKFQVTSINGQVISGAIRDSILISGGCGGELSICFDSLNPGIWVLLSNYEYNILAGQITTIEYS